MDDDNIPSSTSPEKMNQIQETSHLLNPFIHRLDLSSTYDKFKLVFMSVFVFPIRIFLLMICLVVAYIVASAGLWGLSRDELSEKPLRGWRAPTRIIMGFLGRTMMRLYCFNFVKIHGQQASRSDAPIMVVGPHSSFFDAILCYYSGVPSLVSRIENTQIPFFGKYIDYTQPVYVWRESTDSKVSTIQEIKRRAYSKEDWPQILVFPEGTCTNRSCLITFKPGAFFPGVPVQPVVLRYPNKTDSITWTWDGPGALKMIWVTLCQFHNYCEIEFLPVYHPSQAEIDDARLFASNVRQVMADALHVPVADYTYDDCRLMQKSQDCKLPSETGLVEFQKLKSSFGVTLKTLENEILPYYASIARTNGKISKDDFAKHFGIPKPEVLLSDLMNLYELDKNGLISFRNFVVGYYTHAIPAATSEENLSSLFNQLDADEKGFFVLDDAARVVKDQLALSDEEVVKMWNKMDKDRKKRCDRDDLRQFALSMPECALLCCAFVKVVKSGKRIPPMRVPEGKQKAE